MVTPALNHEPWLSEEEGVQVKDMMKKHADQKEGGCN